MNPNVALVQNPGVFEAFKDSIIFRNYGEYEKWKKVQELVERF